MGAGMASCGHCGFSACGACGGMVAPGLANCGACGATMMGPGWYPGRTFGRAGTGPTSLVGTVIGVVVVVSFLMFVLSHLHFQGQHALAPLCHVAHAVSHRTVSIAYPFGR